MRDTTSPKEALKPTQPAPLLDGIRTLIEAARRRVAATVNTELTMLYWQIGKRIREELLRGERAEYGKQIVSTLSRQLVAEYGRGFSYPSLTRMVNFAELFPDSEIVASLIRQLSWTHFIQLLPLKQPLQREFYAEMCRVEGWSVRTLRRKIGSMLYERTALSKKPAELIRQEIAALRDDDRMTPALVFRDPYVLDFLELADTYGEKDLESAILREMQRFILELGVGFSFVARQKRMVIDNQDHYLDLLFYHRKLKRLVAIELKMGQFKAAHKGQMELYLRWLEKYETEPGEKGPLGFVLCTEGARETIELLQLDASGIHVAEYLTELPPKALFEEKLHQAVLIARERFEDRKALKEPRE